MGMYDKRPCSCPVYEDSDFWNDPHLWCGCDATHEVCWMKVPAKACEITYDYRLRPDYWADARQQQTQMAMVAQMRANAGLQNPYMQMNYMNSQQRGLGMGLQSLFGF